MEILTESAVVSSIIINTANDSNAAMIAAIFSAIAAFISCVLVLWQIRQSREQKKEDNLNQAISNIASQRQHYYTTIEALYRWEDTDTEQWNYLFKGVLRAYLNTYEYACNLYCENRVNKKSFEARFKEEIIGIYKNDIGKDYGLSLHEVNSRPEGIYSDIRKVAKQFLEKTK